jgi:hypothetical protein
MVVVLMVVGCSGDDGAITVLAGNGDDCCALWKPFYKI